MKLFCKRVPTIWLGGFNRGRVTGTITISKDRNIALMRFCRVKKGTKPYPVGENVDANDIGEPFADIAFMDREDMRLMGEHLLKAYNMMVEGDLE